MYDALRKAEAERKKAGGNSASKAGVSDNIKAVLLLIAVIAVFTIAIYRFNGAKTALNATKPVIAQAVAVVPTPAKTAVVPAPLKPQRAPGTYGLDGIIDAGTDSMAVINGKLMKPEDSIDNLILKKISPKEVELLNTKDNSTVILKLN
jgi:hypothetical protein